MVILYHSPTPHGKNSGGVLQAAYALRMRRRKDAAGVRLPPSYHTKTSTLHPSLRLRNDLWSFPTNSPTPHGKNSGGVLQAAYALRMRRRKDAAGVRI